MYVDVDLYYIGLDIGTTNIKSLALSSGAEVISAVSESMVYDTDGARVEFDIGDFYRKVCALIKRQVGEIPKNARPAGVCISSASGNTVLLDANNDPLFPAISWLDKRQEGDIEAVMGTLDPASVYKTAGWPLSDGFPLAHLCMIKRAHPGLLEKASRIGMSTDYLNMRLCGAWAMDRSTATTFYLQDQVHGTWHGPYLEALGIPASKLPLLLPVGTRIGKVTPEASVDTLLPTGTPVYLGSFDHPSAAIGANIIREGQLLLSCGTSWVGFTPVKSRERVIAANLLCDPFLENSGLWGGYFSLPNAGQRLDMHIERFISANHSRFEEFDGYAARSVPGANGLKINIYDEPSDNFGSYNKKDIARALMENIAYLLKEKLMLMEEHGISVNFIVMAGGPSRSPVWPSLLSDVIGMSVQPLPFGTHAGAIGAAKIAAGMVKFC